MVGRVHREAHQGRRRTWNHRSLAGQGRPAPFFFELAGGAQSQLGLQYLTGEVFADGLDTDEADLIATDRASVLWEHPVAEPLLEWGKAKIRELLRVWSSRRSERQLERLKASTSYMEMVAKFPEREQKELLSAIDTLAGISTIENDRLDEIVGILIGAYENDHFLSVIRALRDIEETAQDEIVKIIEEWDVIEAVQTAQLVRGRVEIIRTFEAMIKAKVPEKPDMHEFLKKHPWLLAPELQQMEHERSLDKVLHNNFDDAAGKTDEGRRRLDFFCLADSSSAVVVELKRPGDLVDTDEVSQLEAYVDYLRLRNEETTLESARRMRITGVLVYSRMKPAATQKADRMKKLGDADIVTWDALLERAERLHKEYLEVMVSRAPSNDPRIEALEALDTESDAPDGHGDQEAEK